ncbi:regulator of microtubule dynamics protein 1 [Anguilla rostrata]|uniref:regulator of microtubule dynamics protein 1 n=1 Tax=Anguilla rostrata TaxID=7938 RepID=UPI0030D49ABF
MAGIILTRSISRSLLPASKHVKTKGLTRQYWTLRRKPLLTGGRTATLLLSLPALSFLGSKTYRRLHVVHALDKAEEDLEQADYLYSCGDTEKLHQLLLPYKDSEDAELLWRLARTSRDLGQLSTVAPGDKKRLAYEAFEYAKRALEKDDACFAAHKWYAVCLSDIGEYEGIKVKIGNSYIIKEHLERAIELNPKDATSFHILGYWCFAFAELPWYQRKVAAMIFASPPTATYEEALEFFLKAEEVDPNFYSMNLLMLGKTYLMLGERDKAIHWLSKSRDYPAHNEEDREVHKQALDLLKKING